MMALSSFIHLTLELPSNFILGWIITVVDATYRFMPPTLPVLGRPCFAVVFARLIVTGVSQGIRKFIVRINNGFKMCPGISAQ
jgi:hypothetical protein